MLFGAIMGFLTTTSEVVIIGTFLRRAPTRDNLQGHQPRTTELAGTGGAAIVGVIASSQ